MDCAFGRHNPVQNGEQANMCSIHIFKAQKKENSLQITDEMETKLHYQNGNDQLACALGH